MKILHMATGFPISYQGGITNYVRCLAEHQAKEGDEVWVLSAPDEKEHAFNVQPYKSDKIIPMKLRAPKDPEGLDEIEQFLSKEQFDIIHIHMVLDVDWNLYKVVKPYKYIVSLHDYFFLCPRIQMMKFDNSLCTQYEENKCAHCISLFNLYRFTNALEYKVSHYTKWKGFRLPEIPQKMTSIRYSKYKRLLESANLLLPVSSRVRDIYANSGINGKYMVSHIGNVSADEYTEKFEYDFNKKKMNVVMLGTLSYMKGGDIFLKLADALDKNKFEFHFYGRSNSYKDRLAKHGIIDHGSYNQSDLHTILKTTDFGLVLSVWEDNGPQVVMEFLNNHVPVIGTRMGGIPDFIKDGENGFLIDPYNDRSIDELIDKLESVNRENLFKLKKNIQRTTTTEEHCNQIEVVYKEILKEKSNDKDK